MNQETTASPAELTADANFDLMGALSQPPKPFLEVIGKATLYKGDMRKLVDTVDLSKVTVIITDPNAFKKPAEVGQEKKDLDFIPLGSSHIKALVKVAVKVPKWTAIFCDSHGSVAWRRSMEKNKIRHLSQMVWEKMGAAPEFRGRIPAHHHDIIEVFHGPGSFRWNGGGKGGIYRYPVVRDANHKSVKPLELMKQMILDFTDPDDVVFDPFAGLGTTMVACMELGRKCIGFEMKAKYAKLASLRIRQLGLPFQEQILDLHLRHPPRGPHGLGTLLGVALDGHLASDLGKPLCERLGRISGLQFDMVHRPELGTDFWQVFVGMTDLGEELLDMLEDLASEYVQLRFPELNPFQSPNLQGKHPR